MKRAAIIIAGPAEGNVACHVWVAAGDGSDTYLTVHPSERLLADLRTLTEPYPDIDEWNDAAARVRAAIGDNDAPRT